MPVNKFALIRYKTIDNCLQNRFRRWTLDDLVEECADALYEYEGIGKGVSRRTIQLDLQNMRSDKLGYSAPIEVIDKKHYRYAEKDYSITNIPLTSKDLGILSESVGILKQFKGFSHFREIGEMVTRLESKIISQKANGKTLIHFERNDLLRGLEFLDPLHNAMTKKVAISIMYKSFQSREGNEFVFFPYLLKEYRNRWFVLGINEKEKLMTLALDRVEGIIEAPKIRFRKNTFFEPDTFYDNIIGVTKDLTSRVIGVKFWTDKRTAPYMITKPLHPSQRIVNETESGTIFQIDVAWNLELERELLGFGESLRVLGPRQLLSIIKKRLEKSLANYSIAGVDLKVRKGFMEKPGSMASPPLAKMARELKPE